MLAFALVWTAHTERVRGEETPTGTARDRSFLQEPARVGQEEPIALASPALPGADPGSGEASIHVWTLSWPDASYIAPHFSSFDLPPRAHVVVRTPDGSRTWTYRVHGQGAEPIPGGFWSVHIRGPVGDLVEGGIDDVSICPVP